MEINNKEIEFAEKILLPNNCFFNQERVAFIKNMTSRDVIACPGSGKTTALLAKILILSKKMPFPDNRGLCVLTHTNVAIDMIKTKTEINIDSLLKYPNFFGTIQSFVNKFYTYPGYRSEYNKEIETIDTNLYKKELEILISSELELKKWISTHCNNFDDFANFWFNPSDLHIMKNIDTPIIDLEQTDTIYKKICVIRKKLLTKGILSYNDAYSLALRYISMYPHLKKALQNRFFIVLLDEAQDTDKHQIRVLENTFDCDQVIFQCLGDPNQAIFNSSSDHTMIWNPRRPLHFSDTLRYGEKIASILKSVRLDHTISLRGNKLIDSNPPYILTFRQGQEQKVLEFFAQLILKLKIPEGPFYAIGWVGTNKTKQDKLCIPSYFPNFDKKYNYRYKGFNNLISYFDYAIQQSVSESPNHFFKTILEGMALILKKQNIINPDNNRSFTTSTLKEYLKKHNEKKYLIFCELIARFFLSSCNNEINCYELKTKIKNFLKENYPLIIGKDQSLWEDDFISLPTIDKNKTLNQYISDDGVKISISTVHSVKGESHHATLFLETFFYTYDSKRLIKFFKGIRPSEEFHDNITKLNLKIAHVGFSRPRYLLVFACLEKNIEGCEDELLANGWMIYSV